VVATKATNIYKKKQMKIGMSHKLEPDTVRLAQGVVKLGNNELKTAETCILKGVNE
jgi:hypothetical protein